MTVSDLTVTELLRQSLRAWGVEGDVARADDGFRVRAAGHTLLVAPAPPGLPFRWMVTVDGRRRSAASLSGVLRHMRSAVDPGYAASRVRIALAPLVPQ